MITVETIQTALKKEKKRQQGELSLIASENYASQDVLDACGHCVQNKYAEGYVPQDGKYRRYYAGCVFVDTIEQATIDLACQAFGTKFANVQPHSGSNANLAAFGAATKYFKCKPADLFIIGQSLDTGGHLSHSSKVNISGAFFPSLQYGLDENERLNLTEIERLLHENKDKNLVLVIGASAYARVIDYAAIAAIVRTLDKPIFVLHDVAHTAGLIVAGYYPNPLACDWGKAKVVLTTTTHKTLRGARHALITTNDAEIAPMIDKAVFPFLQGGPLENMIAGVGIALAEALQPSFKTYIGQVLKNIKAMEKVFKNKGITMVSGGSDNHLILLNLVNKGISGQALETELERLGIICNKNAVLNDPLPKMETSGIRVGTAPITTRGMTEKECAEIAGMIATVIAYLSEKDKAMQKEQRKAIKARVKELSKTFPIYKR